MKGGMEKKVFSIGIVVVIVIFLILLSLLFINKPSILGHLVYGPTRFAYGEGGSSVEPPIGPTRFAYGEGGSSVEPPIEPPVVPPVEPLFYCNAEGFFTLVSFIANLLGFCDDIIYRCEEYCNDDIECTQEGCDKGGNCVVIDTCCKSNDQCDDSNSCTNDWCNDQTGICVNNEINGCCKSGDDCESGEDCIQHGVAGFKCVDTCDSNTDCDEGSCLKIKNAEMQDIQVCCNAFNIGGYCAYDLHGSCWDHFDCDKNPKDDPAGHKKQLIEAQCVQFLKSEDEECICAKDVSWNTMSMCSACNMAYDNDFKCLKCKNDRDCEGKKDLMLGENIKCFIQDTNVRTGESYGLCSDCNTNNDCQGGFVCRKPNQYQELKACLPCISDLQCQDKDPCNGFESCVSGICEAGKPQNCNV